MSTTDPTLFDRSRSVRATIWFLRVQQKSLGVRGMQRFEHWIAEPANRQAFRTIAKAWIATDPRARRALASLAHIDELLFTHRRPASAESRGLKSSPLFLVAVALLLALAPKDVRRELEGVPTTIVTHEQQAMSLDDGSIVKVSPGTELTVDFSSSQRRIYLASGQATFDVARDPQRPFRVLTPAIRIEAVGTRFSVSLYEQQFTVAVAEGSVRLTPHGTSTPQTLAITLTAGEMYTAPQLPVGKLPASSAQFDAQQGR